MYRLQEYYRTGSTARATQVVLPRPLTFPTLEEARTRADATYQELRRIPESENIFLLVHDASDRIVYTVPEHPFGK